MDSMPTIAALLLCAFEHTQDDSAHQAREFVEKLRSDNIEERQEAARKLKELGRAAVPEVQRVAQAEDSEVALRAGEILHWVKIDTALAPALKRAIPDAVDRLAQGQGYDWTKLLVQALAIKHGLSTPIERMERRDIVTLGLALSEGVAFAPRGPNQLLKNEDLVSLVVPALRAAKSEQERDLICMVAGKTHCRESVPELRSLLKNESWRVRAEAARALGEIGAKASVQDIIPLLADTEVLPRHSALVALCALRAKEGIPHVAKLLEDEELGVRFAALEFAITMEARELLPGIVKLFDDRVLGDIVASDDTWERLGGQEVIPSVLPLLKHADPSVRRGADRALKVLCSGRLGVDEEKRLRDLANQRRDKSQTLTEGPK